jgi:outer membrane receptor protein involved in Fe transport
VISESGVDSVRLQKQISDQDSRSLSLSAGFSFRERLWEKSYIETNYSISHSSTSNIKETLDVIEGNQVFNPDLSNNFDYQFISHRIGMNYRFIDKKMNYTVGVNALPTLLKGQNISKDIQTMKKTFNFAPSARFVYNFTRQKSFDLTYFTRNVQPSFLQLQPIADNSNLQNVVTGNPDLSPEFAHSLVAHYKQSDWNQGHILYANAAYNQTQDKIVTTKVLVPGTVNQLTSYTNTDGFYNLSGDYFYSKPFFERKFTIEYSGAASMNNNVAFIDNNKNIAKNKVWRQEMEFKLDLEDIVDVELEVSYSQNHTTYSQPSFKDRQTNRFEYSVEGRSYYKKFTLGYDFSKTINSGFDNSFVNNPMLLRLYAEYKFLKKDMGAFRLDGFDLFDQNSGISRDVFDNVIVDRQVNRLGRFFMLSFILRMQKFGG